MNRKLAGLTLIGTLALTGCATDPAYIAYRQKQDALGKYAALTGSLSNGDSTPHTLKIVGNKEYNDNRIINSLSNETDDARHPGLIPRKPRQ